MEATTTDVATNLSDATDATNATLDALAREFATLPVPSLAPALILLLGGLLLIVAGRHFLRPVLVITLIAAGALLGAPVLGAIAPDFGGSLIGRVVLTAVGAALGLVVVACLWRLVYGMALGLVLAFGLSLLALIGIDAGAIDARARDETPHAAAAPSPTAQAFAERAPEALRPLLAWGDARWHSEPPQVRTFLTATAAGGAFIGVVLGAWMPQASAAVLTSLLGSAFTLVGALPFLARFSDRFAGPVPPIAWILLWLALALLGWLLQTWRGDPDAPEAGSAAGAPPNTGNAPPPNA